MKKSNNPLIGKWRTVCWSFCDNGNWTILKSKPEDQCVWDFQSDGTLIESFAGGYHEATKYYYIQDENFLGIDRSDYAADGYMLACIEEHFRVELHSDRCATIYDLVDIRSTPNDCMLKVELERI